LVRTFTFLCLIINRIIAQVLHGFLLAKQNYMQHVCFEQLLFKHLTYLLQVGSCVQLSRSNIGTLGKNVLFRFLEFCGICFAFLSSFLAIFVNRDQK
jgi:hypothetical protein